MKEIGVEVTTGGGGKGVQCERSDQRYKRAITVLASGSINLHSRVRPVAAGSCTPKAAEAARRNVIRLSLARRNAGIFSHTMPEAAVSSAIQVSEDYSLIRRKSRRER